VTMRLFASRAIFPLVMGGCVLGAGLTMGETLSPLGATLLFNVIAAAMIIVAERLIPYCEDWNRSHDDVGPDLGHMIGSMLVVPELIRLAIIGTLLVASTKLTLLIGQDLWPHQWPLALQLALALVAGELGQYGFHRLSHEKEFLWRIHALHHSAPRLYWLNAGRFHPLDTAANYLLSAPLLILLGCGEEVIALFLLVTGIHGMFQHANIDVKLGPLNWVFSMAELHRWHHVRDTRESLCNYGANLIVWDIVFGTRYLPSERQPPTDIGIGDMPDFPKRYIAQLASPFQWPSLPRINEETRTVETAGTLGDREERPPAPTK